MTTTGLVVICLTVVMISLLVFLGMMLRWAMTSQDRRSSTQEQTQKDLSKAMERQVEQAVEIVRLQMQLTELVLVGRPSAAIELSQENEKKPETLPTPDELWRDLPPNIQDAMRREAEEASTWQNLSERQPEVSVPDDLGEMEEQLRASLNLYETTPAPAGEGSNSG